MGTHPIFESDFDCLTEKFVEFRAKMSDIEDFEIVDEMGEKAESTKVENASQDSTISSDTYDKTKSTFDQISTLFKIEKTDEMFEKNKNTFNNLIEKIDSFSEKMINLINDRRNKVKEDIQSRATRAISICENIRHVYEDLEAHIKEQTDSRETLEKHKETINKLETTAEDLNSLRNIKIRDLRFPESEITELYDKLITKGDREEKSKSRSSRTEPSRRDSRRENESSKSSSKRPNSEPISRNDSSSIKRPRDGTNRDKDLRTNNSGFSRFESADAEPLIAGSSSIDKLGQPFGKELTGFNIAEIALKKGAIGATFMKKFGNFDCPMGCDIMKEEVIICNMNSNTVHFHELDGSESLVIKETDGGTTMRRPSQATVLLDARIVVRDDNGVHVFDDEANFSHSLDLPRNIKIYGVLPVRTNGGMLGIFAQMGMTYKLFFFDRDLRNIQKEIIIKLPNENKPMIRFSCCLGNTIYLSDMSFDNNCIWICDLEGNVRKVAGVGGKGSKPGQFVQAAGVTIDNSGNFLAICSKTSRIMAFKADGEFICEIQFESGPVERPTDISINDDGVLAVTSLKGQVHLLSLIPIEPSQNWETQINTFGGHGGGRGRGGRGGFGGRGRGRGNRGRGRGRD